MLYGLMVIGGLIGACGTWASDSKLGRRPFGLYLAAIVLAGLVLAMLPLPPTGQMVVMSLWAGVAGGLLWLISSARSRDAYGSTYLAIGMFLPFICLFALMFLLFKGSRHCALNEADGDEAFDNASTRPWLSRGLSAVAIACVLGLGLGAIAITASIHSLGSKLDETFANVAAENR